MELTIDNLEKIKRLSEKYAGFWRLEFTFFDLIDLFGNEIWCWEKIVSVIEEKVKVIDISIKLQQVEKELIINALELTQYNQHEAAKLLNINQVTINRRIKKYKITNNNWKKNKEVKYDGSI